MQNWLNTFEYLGSYTKDEQNISSYKKMYSDYYISVIDCQNEWGGKRIISVILLPEIGTQGLRSPTLDFFATGFTEFEALEKKIKEEIVPTLKSWAIKTI